MDACHASASISCVSHTRCRRSSPRSSSTEIPPRREAWRRTNVTCGANFIESNTAFLREDKTLDGIAPRPHKHLSKGWFTSELLPILTISPIVTPGKYFSDMLSASLHHPCDLHPLQLCLRSREDASVNFIFTLRHEHGDRNNNNNNSNNNNKGTYAAGKLNFWNLQWHFDTFNVYSIGKSKSKKKKSAVHWQNK